MISLVMSFLFYAFILSIALALLVVGVVFLAELGKDPLVIKAITIVLYPFYISYIILMLPLYFIDVTFTKIKEIL